MLPIKRWWPEIVQKLKRIKILPESPDCVYYNTDIAITFWSELWHQKKKINGIRKIYRRGRRVILSFAQFQERFLSWAQVMHCVWCLKPFFVATSQYAEWDPGVSLKTYSREECWDIGSISKMVQKVFSLYLSYQCH